MVEKITEKDFFISYTSSDEKWAIWVAEELEKKGYTTVVQAWDFAPGENFVDKMHKATINCKKTIAILSQKYFDSLFTQPEWQAAFVQDPTSEKAKLIPVKISDFEPTGLLKSIIYIDLFGVESEEAVKRLIAGVDTSKRPRNSNGFPGTSSNKKSNGQLPFNNIPYIRNINFTGREYILDKLKEMFDEKYNNALTQIISGLGGVGKTQIALEYVLKYGFKYDLIWWVNSENVAVITDAYSQFAIKKGLIDDNVSDINIIKEAVLNWMNNNNNWLFIFDNADDSNIIYDYLPRDSKGHILITSRNTNWASIGKVKEIEEFTEKEAEKFMIKRTGEMNKNRLIDLIKELGYLPLALEQAGAYIVNSSKSYEEYYELYKKYKIEILKKYPPLGYNHTVATTWAISIDKISNESSEQLLNIFSLLAPDNITRDIFERSKEFLPPPLCEKIENELEFDEAVYNLKKYSIIRENNKIYSIHRLVQDVIRISLDKEFWGGITIDLAYNIFDFDYKDIVTWQWYNKVIPHAISIAKYGEENKIKLEKIAYLYHQIATYYNMILADYEQAEILFDEVIRIEKDVYGDENEHTIRSYNNLIGLYIDQGKYDDAESLCIYALNICEKTFLPNHNMTLVLIKCLAQIYFKKSRYDDAEKLYKRVLNIRNEIFGENSNEAATIMGELASIHKINGHYDDAKILLEEALEIKEKEFGLAHTEVAVVLDSLGMVYQKMRRYSDAEELLKRALEIRKKVYGVNHPNLSDSLNNLASLYAEIGSDERAEELYKESLEICELFYKEDHDNIASTLNNLGYFYYIHGRFDKAEQLYERAFKIREKVLGLEHSDTAASINNLAELYNKLNRDEDAENLHKKALNIRMNIFGLEHIDTASSLNNLAFIYYKQNKYSKAVPLFEQALEITQCVVGENHRDTIESMNNLAALYTCIDRKKDAIKLYRKALELSEKNLGSYHELTIMIRNYLELE